MMKSVFIAALAASLALPVLASESDTKMQTFAEDQVSTWLMTDELVGAILAQNVKTAGLSADEIDAMDKTWRAQVGANDTPLITSVLGTDVSTFLNHRVGASGGLIREVFVMDAMGLNVASSGVTSDYWQGDEAKFQETYPKGAGAMHFSGVEFDESTQTYQGQVSLSLTDPATGQVIGAVTFGLNAESFF